MNALRTERLAPSENLLIAKGKTPASDDPSTAQIAVPKATRNAVEAGMPVTSDTFSAALAERREVR